LQYVMKWENTTLHQWEFLLRVNDTNVIYPIVCFKKAE
jgi:hypothetical protein